MRTSSSLAMYKCDETPEKSDATASSKVQKMSSVTIADDVGRMFRMAMNYWHARHFAFLV